MAAGTYKSGVAIIVTYQAVNCATGKTVTMDVYDETHAKDDPKSVAEMTEFGTTGRYYATFTPDAEGEWIVILKNTTDNNGELVSAFGVAGHDVDSIGDLVTTIDALIKAAGDGDLAAMKTILDAESGVKTDVGTVNTIVNAIKAVTDVEAGVKADVAAINTIAAAIQAVTDVESGVKAAVLAQHDFDPATEAVATVTALTGHTPQTGDSFAIVNGASGLVAIKTAVDSTEGKIDTVDTVVDGIQTDLDNPTDGLGAIKDGVDALGSPAMIG